jgi:hypothetical protein
MATGEVLRQSLIPSPFTDAFGVRSALAFHDTFLCSAVFYLREVISAMEMTTPLVLNLGIGAEMTEGTIFDAVMSGL